MNQSMKILDMHCDTLIECWRTKTALCATARAI